MAFVENNVLEYLRSKIRAIMNEHADHIATGGVTDWADYKYHVGVIEGLAKAERELLDMVEKLKEQD
jgi:hypothetical protein